MGGWVGRERGGRGETSFLDRLFILTMIWFLR